MDFRLSMNDENLDALYQSSFPRRRKSMVTPITGGSSDFFPWKRQVIRVENIF
jgi:hypothetical protein